jgi:hypothetical protein
MHTRAGDQASQPRRHGTVAKGAERGTTLQESGGANKAESIVARVRRGATCRRFRGMASVEEGDVVPGRCSAAGGLAGAGQDLPDA